jgi:hypothetical protein
MNAGSPHMRLAPPSTILVIKANPALVACEPGLAGVRFTFGPVVCAHADRVALASLSRPVGAADAERCSKALPQP